MTFMNHKRWTHCLLALGLMAACATALGEDLPEAPGDSNDLDSLSQFRISTDKLNDVRAREGTSAFEQMNQSDQRAWLEQNQLQSAMTGNNVMHQSAMRVEGIGSVIQNTGNQVIIQDTTQINLTITP